MIMSEDLKELIKNKTIHSLKLTYDIEKALKKSPEHTDLLKDYVFENPARFLANWSYIEWAAHYFSRHIDDLEIYVSKNSSIFLQTMYSKEKFKETFPGSKINSTHNKADTDKTVATTVDKRVATTVDKRVKKSKQCDQKIEVQEPYAKNTGIVIKNLDITTCNNVIDNKPSLHTYSPTQSSSSFWTLSSSDDDLAGADCSSSTDWLNLSS